MGLGAGEIAVILSIICCFMAGGLIVAGGIVFALVISQGKKTKDTSGE